MPSWKWASSARRVFGYRARRRDRRGGLLSGAWGAVAGWKIGGGCVHGPGEEANEDKADLPAACPHCCPFSHGSLLSPGGEDPRRGSVGPGGGGPRTPTPPAWGGR